MTHLEKLAFMLAIEAPTRQGKYVSSAQVTWKTIHKLREELDRLGFDWRTARNKYEQLRRSR